jgi:hypothetical protein
MAYAVFILAQVYKKWPEAKKVDFVVSRKQEVTHHLREFKDELQRFVESPLQDLVGELIPASMEDRIPLQSADVLLWHLQRYYAAGRDQYKMNPVDRMRTAELIQNGNLDGKIHEWDKKDLEELADKWTALGFLPRP